MKILPVLDVKGGQVVRGIAGRRHEYRPIVSQLTSSTTPLDIARAFRDHFGFDELYIADLDALAGDAPAVGIFSSLTQAGFRLWVDAGIHVAGDAACLDDAGVAVLIAGLESLAGPHVLAELCEKYTPERVVFSLDLKGGTPLKNSGEWRVDSGEQDTSLNHYPLSTLHSPLCFAGAAISQGIRRLLVLDLARVGVNEGPGTEALCREIAAAFPDVQLAAGGGIRNEDDLRFLSRAGVTIALAASALHDGRVTIRGGGPLTPRPSPLGGEGKGVRGRGG